MTDQTEQAAPTEEPVVTALHRDPAFSEALHDLYEPLRRFAAVVASWETEPDDLVQEAYARVLRTDTGSIRDLGPYLRRVIANLAVDERRRARRAEVARQRVAGDGQSSDSYPSELADLLRLEPQVRGLLYLVEVEGEPVRAAAAAVGMPAASARMALTRARRKMRASIEAELDDE